MNWYFEIQNCLPLINGLRCMFCFAFCYILNLAHNYIQRIILKRRDKKNICHLLQAYHFGISYLQYVISCIYSTWWKRHSAPLLKQFYAKHILSYHQGCISCIKYPSNKLSFIRRVLNKSCRHNLLGYRLVVVSSVFSEVFTRFSVLYVWCVNFSLNML